MIYTESALKLLGVDPPIGDGPRELELIDAFQEKFPKLKLFWIPDVGYETHERAVVTFSDKDIRQPEDGK